MITLWIAILLLGPPQTVAPAGDPGPEGSGVEDPDLVRQANRWVRDIASPRLEVAEAARRDLEAQPLVLVPALEAHLGDSPVRLQVIAGIEAICDRALRALSRVDDGAAPEADRARIEAEFDRAGPSAATTLERAIVYGKGARREAAERIWSRLEAAPPADDAAWERLARTVPLSVPLLRAFAGREETEGRAAATLSEAAGREIARLGSADYRERERAAEVLIRIGDAAAPALREAAASGDPHLAHVVRRILQQVRWRIGTPLVRKIGNRMEGYEGLDWRDRRAIIYRMARLGGTDAVPTLRRIAEVEESRAVRICAAENLARVGDSFGTTILDLEGLTDRYLVPRVTIEIFMGQGIRYLREEEYEEAEGEFLKILEIEPDNNRAHYNLACAYSLGGKVDEAFESLEAAIRNGFDDFDHMEEDEDLDPIRDDPRYRALLEKYDPGRKDGGKPGSD